MDKYEAWLQERINYYTEACLQSADERGYPGTLRFADQVLRESLDVFWECMDAYREFKAKGTVNGQ